MGLQKMDAAHIGSVPVRICASCEGTGLVNDGADGCGKCEGLCIELDVPDDQAAVVLLLAASAFTYSSAPEWLGVHEDFADNFMSEVVGALERKQRNR
jgi:hypothetical protein